MAHSLSLSLPNLHLYSSKPPSSLKPQINVVFFTPSLKIKHTHYNNCSLTRKKPRNNNNNNGASSSSSYSYSSSYPNHHFALLEEDDDDIPITTHNSESTQLEEREKHRVPNPSTGEKEVKFLWGIFTNRWWAKLRGAFGQRFNLEGIICASRVISRDRHMLLPHLTVPDIRYINWSELRRRGFKGVVFDKDNTITLPYALTPWDPLKPSLDTCKAVFGEANVAVFSNSAGLAEFDPDGADAEAVEAAVGLRVIRHRVKKPAGGAAEIETQLGYRAAELVMVGDRRFTDIVFGNRNGFLTVLTEPLSDEGEPFVVKCIRRVEAFLIKDWYWKGLRPVVHGLLPRNEAHLVSLKHPL